MKGKARRKLSLHEKKEASVLLQLFISGNEGCRRVTTNGIVKPGFPLFVLHNLTLSL